MLEVAQLHVALQAEAGLVRAIDGLSLTLQRGQTFALVGESGCGKSMTALALMRLLPDNGWVDRGDVWLQARPHGADGPGGVPASPPLSLLDLPEDGMRRIRGGRLGMIFQEPATSLNPVLTIGRQLVEAIETHTPLRGAAARARALQWLQRVGIPQPEQRLDDYPFRMSGGQKQRVMIAMTLAAEPDFLIADEPTTALDVTIQAQILALLRDLQAERGMGMLLITHDLGVVRQMAHQVALMYAGQIVEVSEAAAFFATPRHPYAQALLRALPGAAPRNRPLAAIAGTVPPLHLPFAGCRFAPRCPQALAHCGSQPPALELAAPQHQVRCWWALSGAGSPGQAAHGGHVGQQPVTAEGADPSDRLPAAPAEPPAAGPVAAALDIRDLEVRFPVRGGLLHRVRGSFRAVHGVSLQVRAGQTVALVGESGSGKTTVGKAVLQLLRRSAQVSGQAWLAGRDLFTLHGEALREARRELQIIFQDPFASLNPRMRVQDVLDEGLAALHPGLGADRRLQRLHRLVDQVGLRRDALQRWPHEFSGGQRQRIAIARALAVQPRVIICDEPTSALDVSVQAQILNLLVELQRELGVSYLFITHNLAVVEHLAHHVVVMRNGQVEEAGSRDAVLGSPRSAYTRDLLAAVPRV